MSTARTTVLAIGALGLGLHAGEARADVMLAGSWDADSIVMFDLDSREYLGALVPSVFNPSGILVLSDGRLLVGSGDSVLQFDARTGEALGTLINVRTAVNDNFLAGNMFIRNGELYVQGWYNATVVKVDPDSGELIDVLIDEGGGAGNASTTMAYGPDNRIYMTEWRRHTVNSYDADTGAYVGSIGFANRAAGIDFDNDGIGYVGEYHTTDVLDDGIFRWGAGQGYGRVVRDQMLHGPHVVEEHDGLLYVGDKIAINIYDANSGASRGWLTPDDDADNFFALAVVPDGFFDCRADVDGDGDADADDFFGYLDLFAVGDPLADIDGDGDSDADDFFAYLDLFSAGC